MTAAAWSVGTPAVDVDEDGTATVAVTLNDGATKQGDLVFTMTEDRHLRVEWLEAPGAEGLTGFEAWMLEGS